MSTGTLERFRGAMGNSPQQSYATSPPPVAAPLNISAPPFVLGAAAATNSSFTAPSRSEPGGPSLGIAAATTGGDAPEFDPESLLKLVRDAADSCQQGPAAAAAAESPAGRASAPPPPVPHTSFAMSFTGKQDFEPAFGSIWGAGGSTPIAGAAAAPPVLPTAFGLNTSGGRASVSPAVAPAAILVRNQHGVFLLQAAPSTGNSTSPIAASAPVPMQGAYHYGAGNSPSLPGGYYPAAGARPSTGAPMSQAQPFRSPVASGAPSAAPPPGYQQSLRDAPGGLLGDPLEHGPVASAIPAGVPSFALGANRARGPSAAGGAGGASPPPPPYGGPPPPASGR